MWLLDRLCPSRDDQYDVCEEHGHEFRQEVKVSHTCDLHTYRLSRLREDYEVSDKVEVVEGVYEEMYRPLIIRKESTSVCRDCGEERVDKERVSTVVLCEDGEYRPFSDLFEKKEDNEQNNA